MRTKDDCIWMASILDSMGVLGVQTLKVPKTGDPAQDAKRPVKYRMPRVRLTLRGGVDFERARRVMGATKVDDYSTPGNPYAVVQVLGHKAATLLQDVLPYMRVPPRIERAQTVLAAWSREKRDRPLRKTAQPLPHCYQSGWVVQVPEDPEYECVASRYLNGTVVDVVKDHDAAKLIKHLPARVRKPAETVEIDLDEPLFG